VLLPFLALDRGPGRHRSRFLAVALALIVGGLLASCLVWGSTTFLPLKLAATRKSETMSVFFFVRGPYSPLPWFGVWSNLDDLAPLIQLLALGCAWSWARARKPPVEVSAVVAVGILVLLYPVGYPQYQMVPFVLGAAWLVRHWDRLRNRTALVVAMAFYAGWIAIFDVIYMLHDTWHIDLEWYRLRDAAGLPTFLFGCAFLGGVVGASRPEDLDAVQ
jgi:hypothetical protein